MADIPALLALLRHPTLFADSKTLVDSLALRPLAELARELDDLGNVPQAVERFHRDNFLLPSDPASHSPQATRGILAHIEALWPALVRTDSPVQPEGSTLVPLPRPYLVPGGRFRECYYWDSFFTLLGLDGHSRLGWLVGAMADNFAHLVDTFGFVPNGTRSYYLSRSQPPMLAFIVRMLARRQPSALVRYLPALQAEYAWWMAASPEVPADEPQLAGVFEASRSTVVRRGGNSAATVLNRYWDELDTPRPESLREDVLLACAAAGDRPRFSRHLVPGQQLPQTVPASPLYRNLRAAAASGWDFSSRWLAEDGDLATIRTLSVLPVDLNCFMLVLEQTLAQACRMAGRINQARHFNALAHRRCRAIQQEFWNPVTGFFHDRDLVRDEPTHCVTAAGVVPLFVGAATWRQAASCAAVIEAQLLRTGGLVTSTIASGEQWDAPNGWAPLQWMAAQGLARYGHEALAREIARRWIATVERVFEQEGRLLEKYDVEHPGRPGGGGEYSNQDGFGWTNGTYVALRAWLPGLV